ncbi:MAG TPA: APC family permease [Actinomycetota bacterium]|nr:APC family permease [Actinomycetota bacterium]
MATRLEERTRVGVGGVIKRILVGRAKPSHHLEHTLLPKFLALPVFSSDPLSSVAYATEEMMLVLALAGTAAFAFMLPIALVIAAVLAIVITSYRQTVRAYPGGGGSYIVAHENLGTLPGLISASALLIDYVLTVSVSVVAGVAAITSAAPGLTHLRVEMSILFIALITLANLRGVKEAGTLFAVPTYGFVACVYVTLGVGFVNCLNGCPTAASASLPVESVQGVSLYLILRAFSSGSTALTGVEAISNGVPAFRRPQSRNAAKTLAVMGAISISMFLGITFLARAFDVHVSEGLVGEKSVLAQIGATLFGSGLMFYVLQAFTALILILAANTAYQDFPRLSSILARDRFMPTPFRNRGDRLVFSNGVVVLALVAAALVWAFDAELTRLIQLYVVGVFTAFTLSQAGMVRRWLRTREPGWKRSAVINAIGAFATGIVLVIVTLTKFTHGAWIVISAMPVMILLMLGVNRHYASWSAQLRRGRVHVGEIPANTIVLAMTDLDAAAAEALGYVRSLRGLPVRYVYLETGDTPPDLEERWRRFSGGGAPLEVVPSRDHPGAAIRDFVRTIERGAEDFVTVVVPEMVPRRSILFLLALSPATRIKLRLLPERGVAVMNAPVQVVEGQPVGVDARPLIPTSVTTIVLVASVHDATLRAVNYARSLQATETKAVFISLDPEEIERIEEDWVRAGADIPLEIVGAPFRDLSVPVLEEIRRATAAPHSLAVVVLPEFVVPKLWQRLLHNNTALFIKRLLLFEPRTVLVSVPYHLD